MDVVYYRKLMKNGALASKFKIDYRNPNHFKHTAVSMAARAPCSEIQKPDGTPLELSLTLHDSNCARCYKLKKKCSRTYPSCDYCRRSNTACEYFDRRKRRLTFEEIPAIPGISGPKNESSDKTTGVSFSSSSSATSSAQNLLEPGRNPILIASLVNHEEGDEPFQNIDLHPSSRTLSAASDATTRISGNAASRTSSRMSLAMLLRQKPAFSVSRNIISLSIAENASVSSTFDDGFLAVKPIADVSLPLAFVHTFFSNYEWKYPFLLRHIFFQKLENLLFQTETLVHLDVYLVMAIGCLIHDANFGTQHYPSFFSDSFVESVVDMISYNIKSEDDLHKAHLLILLSIYAINVGNINLLWNIVGFLNRLVMFLTDFTGRNSTNACMCKRCFWTIFNLDKELSLVLDKPSQLIPTVLIKIDMDFSDTLTAEDLVSNAAFMAQYVKLHCLQDRMLAHRLQLVPADKAALTRFSTDLEAWRVGILLLIHTEYADLSLLQNFIGLVNLDYYYLLIELDQLSSTESFQFTLQFLSNSFSLLLSEVSDEKESAGTSIYSLFWFLKFFKVVNYSVASLIRTLNACECKSELMMLLNDFNGNVQLEINLLKFLLSSKSRPQKFSGKLELYLQRLKTLNQKIMSFNPLSSEDKYIPVLTQEISILFEIN